MKRLCTLAALCIVGSLNNAASAKPTCSEHYIVERGYTLSKIAREAYQDPKLWRYIYGYSDNAKAIGRNPGRVSIGTALQLPPCLRLPEAATDGPAIARDDRDSQTTRTSARIDASTAGDAVLINIEDAPDSSIDEVAVLADGTVRLDAPPSPLAITPEWASATVARQAETGGPLVRLPLEEKNGVPADHTVVVGAGTGKAPGPNVMTGNRRLAMATPSVPDDGTAGTPAPVRLSVTAETVGEADKVMFFRLELSEPPEQSVVIIYTILEGSATVAADFKHRQGVVIFKPGQQKAALAVKIVDDDTVEDVETFKLFITGDTNTVVIANRLIEAFIQDNDG